MPLDPCDHHLARQHPGDYLLGLEQSVRGAIAPAKRHRRFSAEKIIGIDVYAAASRADVYSGVMKALLALKRGGDGAR